MRSADIQSRRQKNSENGVDVQSTANTHGQLSPLNDLPATGGGMSPNGRMLRR